jgi:hypothetical protein
MYGVEKTPGDKREGDVWYGKYTTYICEEKRGSGKKYFDVHSDASRSRARIS